MDMALGTPRVEVALHTLGLVQPSCLCRLCGPTATLSSLRSCFWGHRAPECRAGCSRGLPWLSAGCWAKDLALPAATAAWFHPGTARGVGASAAPGDWTTSQEPSEVTEQWVPCEVRACSHRWPWVQGGAAPASPGELWLCPTGARVALGLSPSLGWDTVGSRQGKPGLGAGTLLMPLGCPVWGCLRQLPLSLPWAVREVVPAPPGAQCQQRGPGRAAGGRPSLPAWAPHRRGLCPMGGGGGGASCLPAASQLNNIPLVRSQDASLA